MKYFFLALILFAFNLAFGQNVSITPSGITPAMSGTYPRLSYDDLVAITDPTAGDIAYDTTFNCLRVYNGTKWVCTNKSLKDPTPNITPIATAGGTNSDVSKGIAVDTSGNVYISGDFEGTTTFGDTSVTSAGSNDIFVAKYNIAGNLQWVQTAGGTSIDKSTCIATDPAGNVYIAGLFQGTATFGDTSLISSGNYDIFVAKYSTNGTLKWTQKAGGVNYDISYGITVDDNGNVYTTGIFNNTAAFGDTSITSSGYVDIFAAKYNTAGTIQWVQTAGGSGSDHSQGIAIDTSGNVYITGSFYNTANFGTKSKTSSGLADIFAAKYDPVVGDWTWLISGGGISQDAGQAIVVDASGSVHITGFFNSVASFGGQSMTSLGSNNPFLIQYKNIIEYGTSYLSFYRMQSIGMTGVGNTHGMALDPIGNVYITGYFSGTATFSPISTLVAETVDAFMAKYSTTGNFQWVQSSGGANNAVRAYSIAADTKGNVYSTGTFSGTTTFGPTNKTSKGSSDIFVVRLQQ